MDSVFHQQIESQLDDPIYKRSHLIHWNIISRNQNIIKQMQLPYFLQLAVFRND